jgi:hypothetical protein
MHIYICIYMYFIYSSRASLSILFCSYMYGEYFCPLYNHIYFSTHYQHIYLYIHMHTDIKKFEENCQKVIKIQKDIKNIEDFNSVFSTSLSAIERTDTDIQTRITDIQVDTGVHVVLLVFISMYIIIYMYVFLYIFTCMHTLVGLLQPKFIQLNIIIIISFTARRVLRTLRINI